MSTVARTYRIGDVAALVGTTPRTIRYYEEIGLLTGGARQKGTHRVYTDGDVLEGVRYEGTRGASTESLVMRSRSGTVRRIQSRHDRDKLRALTGYRHG